MSFLRNATIHFWVSYNNLAFWPDNPVLSTHRLGLSGSSIFWLFTTKRFINVVWHYPFDLFCKTVHIYITCWSCQTSAEPLFLDATYINWTTLSQFQTDDSCGTAEGAAMLNAQNCYHQTKASTNILTVCKVEVSKIKLASNSANVRIFSSILGFHLLDILFCSSESWIQRPNMFKKHSRKEWKLCWKCVLCCHNVSHLY